MSKDVDRVLDFLKEIDADLEGYFASPLGTARGDDLAMRLKMAGHLIEELADEISIWRSFMVPEPVRKRQDVSQEICGND